MEDRTCSCGGIPEFTMGIPRCVECKLERRRAYGRQYTQHLRRVAAVKRGDPQAGDLVTAECNWCQCSFTYVSCGRSRFKCDMCKKRSGAALSMAWAKTHPDNIRASKRRYNGSSKGQTAQEAWNTRLRFEKYGLSKDTFMAMLAQQDNRCAICQTPEPGGKTGAWHVDHDHSCCPGGKSCGACVRGVLCANCNLTLGHAKDDPALLRIAAEYIERHRAVLTI